MTRFDDLLDIYDIIQNINIEIKIISIKYIDLLGKGGGGVDETYVLFLPEHTCFFVLLSLQTGVTHAETHTYGTIAGPDHVSATDDGDITAGGINGWHWKWTDPATGEVYENTYTGDLLVGNRTGTDTVAIQKGKCSSLAARKETSGIYFYSAQKSG